MYMPLASDEASKVSVCDPPTKDRLFASVATSRPITSYTFNETSARSGSVKEIFVVGLNGFG